MRTLGVLWKEISEKDSSFYIEQAAFNEEVVIRSRFNDIIVEKQSLSAAINALWTILFEKEDEDD